MTDVPFVISARFRKIVQTAPYESEEAEVSAQCKVEEGVDAGATIESTMSLVKGQVFIALGKAEGKLVAVSTDPQKRGPGRPKKEAPAETTQAIPDVKTEEKAQPPKAPAEDDDFGDPEEAKVEEITDKALQDACSTASKKPGMDAGKVKGLFQKKYGAQRVSLVKPNERADFLKDLANLVSTSKPGEE